MGKWRNGEMGGMMNFCIEFCGGCWVFLALLR